MSEARTDTTQTRPPRADAQGEAGGSGKHRGGVATDDTAAQPAGRHRRPEDEGSAAA
ncbi:hypothetical protein ABZ695_26415 [Streptomyces sp. NPDC006976]|uniref:Uncharacterized protein n=1 Tax=Streptomyces castrisilvae TaxID=3033811 RepID=A0ABY9HG84_9ACTN|nr:hypothetical protein [Streptomyces sp. Mut1]WLQ33528.1 hypothetical protein P8A18_08705 [Streptomyces sp. Mut1]